MEKTTEKQRKTAINFKIYMKTEMKTYPPPPKKKVLDVNRLLEQSWLAD